MNYEKLKKEFNRLNEKKQWAWAAKYKAGITLELDNDNTTFTFDSEDKRDDCTLFVLKADIGNRWGIQFLLSAVGFKGDYV